MTEPPVRARPGVGYRAILGLVTARLAKRRGAALLVILAVAATITVVGGLLGVGVTSADRAVKGELEQLSKVKRSVGLYRSTEADFNHAQADALARARLAPLLAVSEPVKTATIFPSIDEGFAVLAFDEGVVTLHPTSGRLPAPCDQSNAECEAVAFLPEFFSDDPFLQMGAVLTVAGDKRLRLVGTVEAGPDALIELPGNRGPALAVIGQAGLVEDPRTEELPRTAYWVAVLDPERVHVWDVPALTETITDIRRELAVEDASFYLTSPDSTFEAIEESAATSAGRITFIGSLIVAVLLAFAIFAATIERQDVREEYRRLRTRGATGRHLFAFVAVEAAMPALLGVLLGVVGAAAIVSTIAQGQGAPPALVVRAALLEPAAFALIAGLALIAILAVAIGLHPAAGRFVRVRGIALAAVPALAILIWQQIQVGALDASDLAAGAAGPGTILLPGLLGLAVILASLAALPPVFRRIARSSSGAALPLRLSWLSIAREPLRPAATMTLLAFSVGAAIFGLGYSATLRQSAADVAAFAAGMDILAVAPESTLGFARSVLPAIQAADLGPDVEIHPVTEIQTNTTDGTSISLLGIEPAAIPLLRGWRSDFSTSSPAALAAAIDIPGDWGFKGHLLPAGTRDLEFTIDLSGDPMQVMAVIQTADGSYRQLFFDQVNPGFTQLSEPVDDPASIARFKPGEPAGWRVIALTVVPAGVDEFSFGQQWSAVLTIHGLDGLVDATPIKVELSESHFEQVLRPPAPTDDLILPAIVSPELMAELAGDGILVVEVPTGQLLQVRPVAVATAFPTLTDRSRGTIVIAEAPLLLSLNAFAPGYAEPNEAIIRTADTAAADRVSRALGEPPFPPLFLRSRPALEREIATDPFAIGIVLTLLIGAVAGLALAIAGILIGTTSDLRDDRGELGELEEQGVGPASLIRLAVVRATTLVAFGTVTGLVVGLGLTWFASTSIAVTADGKEPFPAIVVIVPYLGVAAIAIGLVVGLAIAVAVLARQHFGGRLLREVGR